MPHRARARARDTSTQAGPKAVPNGAVKGPGHDEHHVPDRPTGRTARRARHRGARGGRGCRRAPRLEPAHRPLRRADPLRLPRHRLCDADADDVAQLTWLRAVEHIGRLRDPDRFGAWIGTTARHECLRRPARAQARRPDRGRGAAAAVRRRTSTRTRPSSPPSAATRCGDALGALPAAPADAAAPAALATPSRATTRSAPRWGCRSGASGRPAAARSSGCGRELQHAPRSAA